MREFPFPPFKSQINMIVRLHKAMKSSYFVHATSKIDLNN